ncbi:ATPase [Candidatus Woesearchaeota archaeon CG10_big_fil_rev_8_21_14_0_10_47_5]|nr:MAG: ATPase [Candidatus Woesearchaeota archaeon CG10_big_fil_rev_8_21_14_0_10_47_5]
MGVIGKIIWGGFGRLIVRQKAGYKLELGELAVADLPEGNMLLQVFDLSYGSQLSQQHLELASGIKLETSSDLEFFDRELRSYTLASMKSLAFVDKNRVSLCKRLPEFFSDVREVNAQDLGFLKKPANPLFLGNIRSGSRVLDCAAFLDGSLVLSHHVLISAQTGRGKSNLALCMIWSTIGKGYAGVLVLDPHDEYFGRNRIGMKDHPNKEDVVYYSPYPPAGAKTLKINLGLVKPAHFSGVLRLSEAQGEALYAFYKHYGRDWIKAIASDAELEGFSEGTLIVLKRKITPLLDIQFREGRILCKGVFDDQDGMNTLKDIIAELEAAKTVIIDTSGFSGQLEVLIGSIIATEILKRYRHHKNQGMLNQRPVISIVLEEAPRVIGKAALEEGPNIFSTIAREGRKFRVGLTAITQLPSLITKEILANMSTKVIMGLEMASERQAIIESAPQDLKDDDRNIASLGMGEAIISSSFARFALPVKLPLFESLVIETQNRVNAEKYKNSFEGVKTGI